MSVFWNVDYDPETSCKKIYGVPSAASELSTESESRRRTIGFSQVPFRFVSSSAAKPNILINTINVSANFASGSLTFCAPRINTQISLRILALRSGEVDSQTVQLSFSTVGRSRYRLSAQYSDRIAHQG